MTEKTNPQTVRLTTPQLPHVPVSMVPSDPGAGVQRNRFLAR